MATNLKIDNDLLETALQVSGKPSKKAAVTEALEEYIQRRLQTKAIKLFGSIEYDSSYNYKQQRSRK